MEWVREFYDKQNAWSGVYEEEISETNRQNAALIEELAGRGSKRVLELGAGGGQGAAATADLGHKVVAVELVPSLADQRPSGQMTVINEDFYAVALDGSFDVVTYWDGFGVGSNEDQRRLFQRIAGWLKPTGIALLDIGTPWYAASVDGGGWTVGEAERKYSFDAEGCRWEDTWWPIGHPEQAVKQFNPLLFAGRSASAAGRHGAGTEPCQAGRNSGLGSKQVAAVGAAQAVDEVCRAVGCGTVGCGGVRSGDTKHQPPVILSGSASERVRPEAPSEGSRYGLTRDASLI